MNITTVTDNNGVTLQAVTIGVGQTIDGTSASAQCPIYSANEATLVRIKAIGDVWVLLGLNPTAQVEGTCTKYSDGESDVIILPANFKIAVFGGKLNITKTH